MKKILINDEPWQIRIAITQDGQLKNVYFSRHEVEQLERTYFKGKVIKILPGIQTAFVDIGQERAGFLHISEIDRELAINRVSEGEELDEEQLKETPREARDISNILREGEYILTQVSKEPIYEKGAKLTTCFTLPGRFLVLMPNIPRIGISKKIENDQERQRLRTLIKENLPEGMGAIIRTPAEGRPEKEIIRDLHYLAEIWRTIQQKYNKAEGITKLHVDIDVPLQAVRDNLDRDVEEVICDTSTITTRIRNFVKQIAPEDAYKVSYYKGKMPLFSQYMIESQIKEALHKKVTLKSGGSIIIEHTEAMTVIDVNTGRYIGKKNLEETLFNTNLEAAEEIVRQLRLRNIGGLIVIDFIDMENQQNKQKLFKTFERLLRERDKFQSVALRVSEFGIVQMTRKRSGKTLLQQMMTDCPTCDGVGYAPSAHTRAHRALRELKEQLATKKLGEKITLYLAPDLFDHIVSQEYTALLELEKQFGCAITLAQDSTHKEHTIIST